MRVEQKAQKAEVRSELTTSHSTTRGFISESPQDDVICYPGDILIPVVYFIVCQKNASLLSVKAM